MNVTVDQTLLHNSKREDILSELKFCAIYVL